jgi:hypothetical protein
MQQFIATQETASRHYLGLQRLAWATLVASFAVFLIVVLSLPFAFNWALDRIRQDVSIPVRVVSGQVFVLTAGAPSWVVRSEATQLNPGDRLSTHETARAFLDLPDGSTVQVFPDSEVALRKSSVVRYRPEKIEIALEQIKGSSRIGVAPVATPEERSFGVQVQALTARLQEGSFAVEVFAESRGSLAVRLGSAEVTDSQRELSLVAGERVTTVDDKLPEAPLPAAQDLVVMGDFTALSPDWDGTWREEDRSEDSPRGVVTPKPDGVYLVRRGEGHGQSVLVQQVNRPAWDFEALTLTARVKAIYQSLPGGGTAGSEYPIMIRINFRDVTGGETRWYHGFYYDVPTDERYSTKDATRVSQNEWFQFEIDLLELTPRPTFIRSIEIVATGWSYEGAIQQLSLVGE